MTAAVGILVLLGLVGSGSATQAAVWVPAHDRPIASSAPVQVETWDVEHQGSPQMMNQQTVLSVTTPSTELLQVFTMALQEFTAGTWPSLIGIDPDGRGWTFDRLLHEPWGAGPLPLAVGSVTVASRSPVVPVAPAPSAGLLFVPACLGLLGVLLGERQTRVLSGSDTDSTGDVHLSGIAPSLLVLSADPTFAQAVQTVVHRAGYPTRITGDVAETLAISAQASPALLLVDRRVPDWDMLRTSSPLKPVPVITLAPAGSSCSEEHWLADLERGADGTYAWQDGSRLLLAKVRAYLRRAKHMTADAARPVYQVGAVRLDADRREVTIAGERLELSAKPFVLLKTLMQAPARVFRRRELIDCVWGPQFAIGDHTLDVHVHALRRHLERDPRRRCRLLTIKGVGFKLKAADPVPVIPGLAAQHIGVDSAYRIPSHHLPAVKRIARGTPGRPRRRSAANAIGQFSHAALAG